MKLFHFFINLFKSIYNIICGILAGVANSTIGKYAGSKYEGSTILLFLVIGVVAAYGCWKLINRKDFR